MVFSYDANTGATRTGTLTIAGQTLTVTQAGSTYVAAPGPLTTLVSGLAWPIGVAVDGAGNVYIADTENNAIKKWIGGQQHCDHPGFHGFEYPLRRGGGWRRAMSISPTRSNNAIKEWNVASNTVTTLVSTGLNNPLGVAVDAAGNVYIADSENNAIKEWVVASNTVITLVSTGLNNPLGLAVDAAGNVYIADTGNNAVKKWTAANGVVTTLVPTGLSLPTAVAVDGAGNVYIADRENNAIEEWTAANHTVTTLVPNPYGPTGVALDGLGNIYIVDDLNGALLELPRASTWIRRPNGKPRAPAAMCCRSCCPPRETCCAIRSDQRPAVADHHGRHQRRGQFAFTANTSTSTARPNITLLGQTIPVTQAVSPVNPPLLWLLDYQSRPQCLRARGRGHRERQDDGERRRAGIPSLLPNKRRGWMWRPPRMAGPIGPHR